jgi:hypothetical protein
MTLKFLLVPNRYATENQNHFLLILCNTSIMISFANLISNFYPIYACVRVCLSLLFFYLYLFVLQTMKIIDPHQYLDRINDCAIEFSRLLSCLFLFLFLVLVRLSFFFSQRKKEQILSRTITFLVLSTTMVNKRKPHVIN